MSTKISYINEVWNVCTGCSGKACKCRDTCWARDMVRRFPAIHAGSNLLFDPHNPNRPVNFDVVQFHPDRRDKPLHWRKPRRIGVCFTGDIADNQVPYAWQYNIFSMVRRCPQHQFFFLTKQIYNLKDAIANWCHSNPWPENAWSGVSICDQEDADRMLPELLRIPGKHWVSVEPMISYIKLPQYIKPGYVPGGMTAYPQTLGMDGPPPPSPGIHWLVLGCESGAKRRPCQLEWMIDVVEQCKAAGVPVYCKQIQDEKRRVIHDINLFPEALKVRQLP